MGQATLDSKSSLRGTNGLLKGQSACGTMKVRTQNILINSINHRTFHFCTALHNSTQQTAASENNNFSVHQNIQTFLVNEPSLPRHTACN